MEALAELITAIVAFVFEVTIHAVVFVFILFMSIFSSRYRAKLKQQWDKSNGERFAMILGVTLYSTALLFALFVWVPWIGRDQGDIGSGERQSAGSNVFSRDELESMKKTQDLDGLLDVAGDLLKRKLAEQKEKAKQGETGISSPADLP